MIQVQLISFTPDPERVIALAARQTRSERVISAKQLSEDEIRRIIDLLMKLKHMSPFEHAVFTFSISGISRVCSHQLVRHRLASFSQQSQRAVKIKESSFIIPPSVQTNLEARKVFEELVSQSIKAYNKLIELGIPIEDARFVIPQAIETKIVVTMNARELLHFFGLRLCRKAQWEIRQLAEKMLESLIKIAPNVFKYAGPRCWDYGYCPEGDEQCFKEMIKRKKF